MDGRRHDRVFEIPHHEAPKCMTPPRSSTPPFAMLSTHSSARPPIAKPVARRVVREIPLRAACRADAAAVREVLQLCCRPRTEHLGYGVFRRIRDPHPRRSHIKARSAARLRTILRNAHLLIQGACPGEMVCHQPLCRIRVICLKRLNDSLMF